MLAVYGPRALSESPVATIFTALSGYLGYRVLGRLIEE